MSGHTTSGHTTAGHTTAGHTTTGDTTVDRTPTDRTTTDDGTHPRGPGPHPPPSQPDGSGGAEGSDGACSGDGGGPAAGDVRVCASEAEYVATSLGWRPGQPLPVLDGPPLARYRSLLDGRPVPVDCTPRPGSVLSTGGEVSRAAGRLLAVATARPHHHLPPSAVPQALRQRADELVALVGVVDDIDAVGDWPGALHERVGVVTGRSAEALSALVHRSLTPDAPSEERLYLASHPMFSSAREADATQISHLEYLRERRPRMLVLRGQGRECAFGLLDGMICGRNGPRRALTPGSRPGRRQMPCQHGEGCFRTDITEEQLLPAADVHAGVVLTHSCSSVAVGANSYSHAVSLALGLLEGTAVAVIGALGVHLAQRSAQWDLEEALADEAPLGEATRRLNHGGGPLDGLLVRFGLLGDPALVLRWEDPERIRHGPRGPRGGRRRLDPAASAELARAYEVIGRLRLLSWLELDVPQSRLDALQSRVREALVAGHDADTAVAAGGITDDLRSLQAEAVATLVEEIYTRGWSYGGAGLTVFRQISERPAVCGGCGLPSATVASLRHRLEPALEVTTLHCRRCGEAWWTSEAGARTAVFQGPIDLFARRGERTVIGRTLANRGEVPLEGGVGYAFRSRRHLGLPPGTSRACSVAPGESLDFRHEVDLVGHHPQPDAHTTPFVALVGGVYTASMVMLNLS